MPAGQNICAGQMKQDRGTRVAWELKRFRREWFTHVWEEGHEEANKLGGQSYAINAYEHVRVRATSM